MSRLAASTPMSHPHEILPRPNTKNIRPFRTSKKGTIDVPNNQHTRTVRAQHPPRPRPDDGAALHHGGTASLRRRHLGAPRRGAEQLEDRGGGVRAAGCRVSRLLECERVDDRHDEVLPRGSGHRIAGVEPQAVD